MKILMLGNPNSPHIIKWANALNEAGEEIIVAGFTSYDKLQFHKNIKIISFDFPDHIRKKPVGSFSKISYLKVIPRLKKIIKELNPDIVHSHIASSYGLIGALVNFHPFIVSLWGYEVYTFPAVSIIHRKCLEWTFSRADYILSTSNIMAAEASKYTGAKIIVTPFGIDMKNFRNSGEKGEKEIVIGTVKSLEPLYGIEYLIRAFRLVVDRNPDIPLKLLIIGGGSLHDQMKNLILQLKLSQYAELTGLIPYNQIPEFHNRIDIFVALSQKNDESFGVAVIEAEACEKPVIVSNMGGLPEVVDDGRTGFMVPRDDIGLIVQRMEELIKDKELRLKMGKAGREFVESKYNLNDNVKQMLTVYKDAVLYK
jgi:glycosyltransferase involved in cell wall biosynthesis